MDGYSSLSEQIESLDNAALTPIVQRATHCSGALTQWQPVRVQVSMGGISPSLIYRFSGGIQDMEKEQPWSLILKVTSASLPTIGPMFNEMSDASREYDFYRSDLAQEFPSGFRAATSYAQFERFNATGQPEYWIWLEDMGRYAAAPWGPAELYRVALNLGKFNGAYLSSQPLPAAPWLKKEMIRKYLSMAEPSFQRLFANRDVPLIRTLFPPNFVDNLAAFWQQREQNLAFLDRLPQTLCHGDAQYTNMFMVPTSSEDVETVAIDWSGVGIASLGIDLAQFFMMNLRMASLAKAQAEEAALFQGYLDGILAAGWQGNPRLIRLAFTSALLKARVTNVLRVMATVSEDGQLKGWANQWLQERGLSLEEMAESNVEVQSFVDQLFEESLELRSQLSFD